MELQELTGKHILQGVGEVSIDDSDYYSKLNGFTFKLDGIVYTAIEDEDDGYRSYLHGLRVGQDDIDTPIPDTEVIGKMKDKCCYEENNILQLVDIENGKIVLEVGEGNIDDYYPYYVFDWRPENLSINKD